MEVPFSYATLNLKKKSLLIKVNYKQMDNVDQRFINDLI